MRSQAGQANKLARLRAGGAGVASVEAAEEGGLGVMQRGFFNVNGGAERRMAQSTH